MVSLAIRYLNGWAMATDPADRNRAEWPPHPDRVFMALASTHFETDGDMVEREALIWVERQGAPGLWASEATERRVTTTYVPVNDVAVPRLRLGRTPTPGQVVEGVRLLPEHRGRQPRQFPVAIPRDPTVYLVWGADPPDEVRRGLEALCTKMVRVGHSASLVQAWLEDAPVDPNWVPSDMAARLRLRVPGPGRLERLERRFDDGLRPERSRWCGYARPSPQPEMDRAEPIFDARLLMLRRTGGRRLGLESTLALTDLLRRAALSGCPDPVPTWVSGHEPDGRVSRRPHLAFLPLPHVGSEYADGHLVGMGVAIPVDVNRREIARCLNPVLGFQPDGSPRRLRLYSGRSLEWHLELERRESPPVALRDATWTGESRRWATVTPIVFDRHAKGRDGGAHEEEMVALACRRMGLPSPADVVISRVSLHEGVPHSREFPGLRRRGDGGRMRHAHAILTFAGPVGGPVVLGAGRFRGYGLCKPVRMEEPA